MKAEKLTYLDDMGILHVVWNEMEVSTIHAAEPSLQLSLLL